jgi:hypothetical protein
MRHFLSSGILAVMDEFGFERVEEALHRGMVVAVGLAAHRDLKAGGLRHLAVVRLALGGFMVAPLALSVVVGVLAAAMVLALVMDQIKVWLFAWFGMASWIAVPGYCSASLWPGG